MTQPRVPASIPPARVFAAWLGASILLVVRAWPTLDSTVDDAFISARYARHIAEGSGVVFNTTGPPVEGISNLAWTLLLAVAHLLGQDARAAMTGLGLFFAVAALGASMALTTALTGRLGPGSLAAPFLLAVSPALAISATNGLETSMFTFAVLLACWATLAARDDRRPHTGVGLGLLTWVRPEGLAVSGGLVLYDLISRRWADRSASRWSLLYGSLAVCAPTLLWRRWTYGAWLPNTFAAKSKAEFFGHMDANLRYVQGYDELWTYTTALALAALLLSHRHFAATAVTTTLAAGLVAVAWQVNLWMPGGRLLVPSMALICCTAAAPLTSLPTWPRAPWFGVLALFASYSMSADLTDKMRRYDQMYSVASDSGIEIAARHIRRHAPLRSWLAVRDAGVMAHYVSSRVHVAELHPRALTQPHPEGANADFRQFMPTNPEFVVTTVRKWEGRPERHYPTDARVWLSLTTEYVYLGRVQMHHHRYYDVFARSDVRIPALPRRAIISFAGHKPGTKVRRGTH